MRAIGCRVIAAFVLMSVCLSFPIRIGAQVTDAEAAVTAQAVHLSELAASGALSELYALMHPDAQALVPEPVFIASYTHRVQPLNPGVITVTDVTFEDWTWSVSGVNYPGAALVRYIQPLWNGATLEGAMRLAQDESGAWRWFFGRSRAFLENEIARYDNSQGAVAEAPAQPTPTPAAAAKPTRTPRRNRKVAPTPPPAAADPGFLVGDALLLVPSGRADIVDVVAVGSPVGSSVPIALRNNTATDIGVTDVIGLARDETGTLVMTGESSSVGPYLVKSGEVAVGYVSFGDEIPQGLTFEFEPQTESIEETPYGNQDLEVMEITRRENEFVGLARNPTEEEITGPYVVGVCFDDSGAIHGYFFGFGAKSSLKPGESTPFSATVQGTESCDSFLTSALGFKM